MKTPIEDDNNIVHHTLNSNVGGFIWGGETSFAHRRYTHQVMT